MSIQQAMATLLGAMVFGFLCNFIWGKLVDHFGPIGGWVAAGVLVGTVWSLNHGVGLIVQSGKIWVDMGFAAFAGGLVCSTMNGAKISKSVPTVLSVMVGGLIAGSALSVIL